MYGEANEAQISGLLHSMDSLKSPVPNFTIIMLYSSLKRSQNVYHEAKDV